MILEVCWDSLRTLSFWLSQSHGHGSWLECEVALSVHHGRFIFVCIWRPIHFQYIIERTHTRRRSFRLFSSVSGFQDLAQISYLLHQIYNRNTIAGSSLGERIFIYFEKLRFASQRTEFFNFCFYQKINKNGLKWFKNKKILQS